MENDKKENSSDAKSGDAASKTLAMAKAVVNKTIEDLKAINQIRKETVDGNKHGTIKETLALISLFWQTISGRQKLLLVAGICLVGFVLPGSLIALVAVVLVCITIYRSINSSANDYLYMGLFLLVLYGVITAALSTSVIRDPFSMLVNAKEVVLISWIGNVSFWMGVGSIAFHFYKKSRPNPTTHIKCPDCKELIVKEAAVCKHCGCRLISETTTKVD